MMVMKIGASIKWEPAIQAPGKVVAGVAFHGLDAAKGEICVQREKMRPYKHGSNQSGKAEKHDFEGMSIFRGYTEWSCVFVMN